MSRAAWLCSAVLLLLLHSVVGHSAKVFVGSFNLDGADSKFDAATLRGSVETWLRAGQAVGADLYSLSVQECKNGRVWTSLLDSIMNDTDYFGEGEYVSETESVSQIGSTAYNGNGAIQLNVYARKSVFGADLGWQFHKKGVAMGRLHGNKGAAVIGLAGPEGRVLAFASAHLTATAKEKHEGKFLDARLADLTAVLEALHAMRNSNDTNLAVLAGDLNFRLLANYRSPTADDLEKLRQDAMKMLEAGLETTTGEEDIGINHSDGDFSDLYGQLNPDNPIGLMDELQRLYDNGTPISLRAYHLLPCTHFLPTFRRLKQKPGGDSGVGVVVDDEEGDDDIDGGDTSLLDLRGIGLSDESLTVALGKSPTPLPTQRKKLSHANTFDGGLDSPLLALPRLRRGGSVEHLSSGLDDFDDESSSPRKGSPDQVESANEKPKLERMLGMAQDRPPLLREERAIYRTQGGQIVVSNPRPEKAGGIHASYSEKRLPAWTDRILVSGAKIVENLDVLFEYSQQSLAISDHKPVYTTFEVILQGKTRSFTDDGSTAEPRYLDAYYEGQTRFADNCELAPKAPLRH